jgi:hypothetical protein
MMVTFPKYNPFPGEWYYGARCQTCHELMAITMDPEDGEGPHEFAEYPGWIEMSCSKGHQHRYRATELLRLRYQGK